MGAVNEWLPEFRELVVQLITAALGGGAVAAMSFVWAWYQRRQVESRYPVSGRYLSFYEDIENGHRVVVPSVAEFKQKGKSVTVSNELPSGRSWTLEGTILPGGHISGVYSADATYDQGVGSFYLRINGADLDGMWSGYDHSNRMTNSGRYWFRKMRAVTVKKATQSDINDILAISTNVFGYGYLHDLDSTVGAPRASVVVASNNRRVRGFCISYLEDQGGFRSLIGEHNGPIPDDVQHASKTGKLGIIKTIAVDPKSHRRGIGSALFEQAERDLKAMGAESVVVPAWVYKDTTNMAGILNRHGYEFWFWNKEYWKSACENNEFKCVKSEGPQCNCSVAFFRHRLA